MQSRIKTLGKMLQHAVSVPEEDSPSGFHFPVPEALKGGVFFFFLDDLSVKPTCMHAYAYTSLSCFCASPNVRPLSVAGPSLAQA